MSSGVNSPFRVSGILVLLPNNLGDVIMATPVLEGLRARYPDSKCTFFVEQGFEAGLIGNSFCDEIHTFSRASIRDRLNSGREKDGGKELHDQVSALRERKFDLVVNLSQADYVSHLVGYIGGRRILGRRFLPEGNHSVPDEWSRYLYAIPFCRRKNMLHAVDVYRRIAGVRQSFRVRIALSKKETVQARDNLRSIGVEYGPPLVIFQPGAASSAKRWPVESFVALGRRLCEKGRQILVTGAPSEKDLAESIAVGIGAGANAIAGQTTFREVVGCLSEAEACVTGDTALMHAAAGLGIPAFALFGATSPVETGPYGEGHWIFSSRCHSRPCFCRECKSMLCMKSILPETVLACMLDHRAPSESKCDVFRTGFTSSGDYRLVPVAAGRNSYIDEPEARATLCGMGEDLSAGGLEHGPGERAECKDMIRHLKTMGNILQAAQEERKLNGLKRFEEKKKEFESYTGIGSFWAAYLNIALNSVPVIDLESALEQSGIACVDTEARVARSLACLEGAAQSSSSSSS